MTPERVLRFEVPSRDVLEKMAQTPLPFGLQAENTELQFYRVVYYDTLAADLEHRNATVQVRIGEGKQTLLVDVRDHALGDGGVVRRHAESEVSSVDPKSIFSGETEAAQIVRALTDPTRLEPAFELEVTRRVRAVKLSDRDSGTHASFSYDAIIVRRGELTGELFELEVCLPETRAATFDGLVQAFEAQHNARITLAETVTRARDLLHNIELDKMESAVRVARAVAVIAYDRGRVALSPEHGKLCIPRGTGAGQDACRTVLANYFKRSYGRLRYLSTHTGSNSTPAVEIWLAEEVARRETSCVWLRLEDLLEMIGTPQLRDAMTLAAIHALMRSDVPSRAAERSQRGRQPDEDDDDSETATLFELTVSRSNGREDLRERTTKDLPPELLLNPELSRLFFDERILAIVEDEGTPLLERVRFLSMFWSRLDDFFMTRIAEFKESVAEGDTEPTPDGLAPVEQLEATRLKARQMAERAYTHLSDHLLPELRSAGIEICRWADLSDADREQLRTAHESRVEAVITPVIADPTHPFPRIRNLRPAIAAMVRLPESKQTHFVAIQLPSELPRFVPLPGTKRFVPLEEVILAVLPNLYRGVEVVQAYTFRVTRSGNIDIEEEKGDVLLTVASQIAKRPFGEVVRLEVDNEMPQPMRARILREFKYETPEAVSMLSEADIYPGEWLVDLVALKEIAALDIPTLHYQELEQNVPLAANESIFDQLRAGERLVTFPNDSFDATVERLIVDASADPDVIAIKITLYRTDEQSRIVRALAEARSAGKDAFALVELKASFDEQRNIEWARSLEGAGVHVVYSPIDFKVHAKTALVLRREPDAVRQYAYIGTGNLNASTARGYTDLGLFTADSALTEEVNSVFNLLTGYSAGTEFKHLLVSPFTMRDRFLELIEREIQNVAEGGRGYIRIQMNGLADRRMISALYRASQSGVKIDMAVREICCLRPGVPGVSDNIRVTSLLGRFLQHARIFRFENNGTPEYFIGSADWRPRNLSKRVEVVTPIRQPEHRARLDQIMDSVFNHPNAWELMPDGSYVRHEEVVGPGALAAAVH
jgi:polyphosphate kinase